MAGKKPTLGTIHLRILELLRDAAPDGLTIYQIREQLGDDIEVQQHLDKRVRELRYYHKVPLRNGGKYFYEGDRPEGEIADAGVISSKLRAQVLNLAHGRCQMCGRTVSEDEVKLQVDHKIPRNWGGETQIDNLWAICDLCNSGKRDFFASFNDDEMKQIMTKDSVYERIAETLRLHDGEPVPSWLLEFVANSVDFQEDWQKRLRELRYPVIGMKISATRKKTETGKWEAAYKLDKWVDLPSNHKFLIKEHERLTRKKNKSQATDETE